MSTCFAPLPAPVAQFPASAALARRRRCYFNDPCETLTFPSLDSMAFGEQWPVPAARSRGGVCEAVEWGAALSDGAWDDALGRAWMARFEAVLGTWAGPRGGNGARDAGYGCETA